MLVAWLCGRSKTVCIALCITFCFVQASTVTTSLQQLLTLLSVWLNVVDFVCVFHISIPIIHYSCHITEAESEVGYPLNRFKPCPPPPVFLYWPFQGGTSVVVPYCYLFLLSVFILWFSYYVSDIFCKLLVAEWPPIWERAVRFTASAFRKLPSIYVFSYFPFWFEGGMWDLIVSVPDHCLSFYFTSCMFKPFLKRVYSQQTKMESSVL